MNLIPSASISPWVKRVLWWVFSPKGALVVLLSVLFVAFVAVMFFKTAEGYIGQLLGLSGEDLTGTHLQETGLNGTYLQGAYLIGTQMQMASLAGAHLQGAFLHMTKMQGACLRSVQLHDAEFSSLQNLHHDTKNLHQKINPEPAHMQGVRYMVMKYQAILHNE